MLSSFMLLINLIRNADTFKEFREALKDPQNKNVKKAFVLFVITIIFIIILICYLVMFQTLNTPGIRRTMKNSPAIVVGNWWCHEWPFMSFRRSGTMVVIKSFKNNYENPAFNHWFTIEAPDNMNYNITYKTMMKVSFDKDGTLVLTSYKFEYGSGETPDKTYHYRFLHFLSYLILYNIDTDTKLYCSSQPGHMPESIMHTR